MKKIILYPVAAAMFAIGFTSCSKCYECSHEIEIENNGMVEKQTVSDEYCTASPEEIKEKENNGYTCVDK